ncbi:MAG: methyltransferase domain-containing protein [Acidobacteria bacterium]|nr:methyltransferase domain-containing protein [Acidobacteriota bacterium]
MSSRDQMMRESSIASPRRLNIGCGDRPTEGWVNYDNSLSILLGQIPALPWLLGRLGVISRSQLSFMRLAAGGTIRYADTAKRIPEEDGSVDVIYCCHMLEHLSRSGARRFLLECRRVLRPAGAIRIVVPDIRMLVAEYLGIGDADRFVESLYLIPDEEEGLWSRLKCLIFGSRLHLWMYDAESLSSLMKSVGFRSPVSLPPGSTTIDLLEGIDLFERSEESLYVEAVRS